MGNFRYPIPVWLYLFELILVQLNFNILKETESWDANIVLFLLNCSLKFIIKVTAFTDRYYRQCRREGISIHGDCMYNPVWICFTSRSTLGLLCYLRNLMCSCRQWTNHVNLIHLDCFKGWAWVFHLPGNMKYRGSTQMCVSWWSCQAAPKNWHCSQHNLAKI